MASASSENASETGNFDGYLGSGRVPKGVDYLGLKPPQRAIVADQVDGAIDDDHQPYGEPFGCAFMEPGGGTLGPRMPLRGQ